MSDTSAARMKRLRQRHAAGRAMVGFEIELLQVGDWLIEKGFLSGWDSDNPQKISEALKEFVAYHSRYA